MKFYGWVPPTPQELAEVMNALPMPIFGDVASDVYGDGKDKIVLLSDYVKSLLGNHFCQVQKRGDCVSFGSSHAIDYTYITEIARDNQQYEFIALTSTEDIYGGSRVQIGKGRLGSQDGSMGAWAAQYVTQYGTLIRQRYDNDDLTVYSSDRAGAWGMPNKGTPAYLLSYAAEHKVQTVSLIKSYEEARDAIANGYAIIVCSNRGFNQTRDQDGFLQPQGQWNHCMCMFGCNDKNRRKGIAIANSWPYDWVSGPTGEFDMPPGSFWVDANVANDMLKQGDSWAFSDRIGFEKKHLSWRIV